MGQSHSSDDGIPHGCGAGHDGTTHRTVQDGRVHGESIVQNGRESHLTLHERIIIWEVNLARQCLDNFSKIINAHAIVLSLLVTVTFVGFLQPPRGWDSNNGSRVYTSAAVVAFIIFNTLSLCSAICGLLFYVYCSYATILTLGSVPIPDRMDEHGKKLLKKLRSALRKVALPTVNRRSKILFSFLTMSLVCCVAAYAAAGLGAVGSSRAGQVAVIAPLILGFIGIFTLLLMSTSKMILELKFEERLKYLWTCMGEEEEPPENLDEVAKGILDPMPEIQRKVLSLCWHTAQNYKKLKKSWSPADCSD